MDFFVLNFLVSIDEKNAHGNSLYNLAFDFCCIGDFKSKNVEVDNKVFKVEAYVEMMKITKGLLN
jgi:hypothetical protein